MTSEEYLEASGWVLATTWGDEVNWYSPPGVYRDGATTEQALGIQTERDQRELDRVAFVLRYRGERQND